MKPCIRRQKLVKRSEGLTVLRCINKDCGLNGHEVCEDVCDRCPVRKEHHKRPCADTSVREPAMTRYAEPPVTSQEMIDVSDADVLKMIVEAGMDASDLTEAATDIVTPNYPAMNMQIWTYKEALIKWHKAGRPTRTDEEVEHIHKTHCLKCDWHDPEQDRCRGCGCRVTVGAIAVFNKLRMQTEHCPMEKF